MKLFAQVVGVLATWGLSSVASAITMGLADNPAPFTISGTSGGYVVTASGTIDITYCRQSADAASRSEQRVHARQRRSDCRPSDARLASWGFGVGPNATSVSFVDAVDGGVTSATLASIPGLGQIEVCVWGGNNCSGGANQGLLAGASDTFDLTLTGQWGSSVTFDPLGVKFQGRGGGQFGCTNSDCTPARAPGGLEIGTAGGGSAGPSFNGGGSTPEPHSTGPCRTRLLSLVVMRRRDVA